MGPRRATLRSTAAARMCHQLVCVGGRSRVTPVLAYAAQSGATIASTSPSRSAKAGMNMSAGTS